MCNTNNNNSLEETKHEEETTVTKKYDPQAEYFARQTPTAQRARRDRKSHQFANSIGGDSSNYLD